MKYQYVIVNVGDDFVGEIALNRPDQLNTFNTAMALELDQALQALDQEKQVRVIILKSAGRAFCAGIDIGEFRGKTTLEYREWVACMENPLLRIGQIGKPVIAQVQGVAAANGAGLVAAADLAVMAHNARMGLTAINVGLNCVGPVVPVSRSIGRKRALELLLYGELINADRAAEMGLVNRVVPAADLDAETRSWAVDLARKSPVAVQIAKKAYYTAEDLEYRKAFAYMNEAFARLCSTDDAEEGIRAFFEKRPPHWKER